MIVLPNAETEIHIERATPEDNGFRTGRLRRTNHAEPVFQDTAPVRAGSHGAPVRVPGRGFWNRRRGGYTVEALVRSGIGALDLIDDDRVCLTNLNRQLHATRKTVGKYKVDAAEERVHEINPDCQVRTFKTFFMPETRTEIDFSQYDYIVDAIDTVTGKLAIVEQANLLNVPVICAMGAGNKLDPTAFRVADIYKTSMCPLAKVMRKECRRRGIKHLKVVYSTEIPTRPLDEPFISCRNHCICPPGTRKCTVRRDIPGSTAFVPSVVGLIIAGEVIKDLCKRILANRSPRGTASNRT